MSDDELKRLIAATAAEVGFQTRQHFDDVAAEMRRHSEEMAAETRRHSEVIAADTRRHSEEMAAETRRHFDVVAEGLRHEIQILGEGHLTLSARIDRLVEEMNDRFSQTDAEIKALAIAVKARFERLEARH